MSRIPFLRRGLMGLLVLVLILGLGVPLAAAQDGGESRTITDMAGRSVTLDAPPQKVLGLS
ncbi:MAG: hypothetical protein JXQ72_02725, partial [Anaerolineae bacterium]|nr:hypothetical protein [Anaerolineae bacterium]